MCDTVVVVEAGRVLFAKNSDRDPNEGQALEWHPARQHREGSPLQCTWIRIPQVAETHAVLISRPFWMWGAEIGANGHGVVIGNEAVFTREPVAELGLTGMDLLRLALERAATAEEAVETICTLLETHGQGGGCGHEDRGFRYHNSFLVADSGGAFVLETAGRHHVVERVQGARSISNGLTLEPFASRHRDALRTRVAAAERRRACTQELAERATGPGAMMHLLRQHRDGHVAPAYSRVNGAMSAPCMHAGGLVAASQTTASWVSELGPDGVQHFATATAAPCTSLFKPVAVDEPLDLGATPGDRADTSLWWRHERLHRQALRDPERLLPLFTRERDELERAWTRTRPKPADAFAEADRVLDTWQRRVSAAAGPDARPGWVRRYWKTRNTRAGV